MAGMEIRQFTYFRGGGLECRPITGEINYGPGTADNVTCSK